MYTVTAYFKNDAPSVSFSTPYAEEFETKMVKILTEATGVLKSITIALATSNEAQSFLQDHGFFETNTDLNNGSMVSVWLSEGAPRIPPFRNARLTIDNNTSLGLIELS